MQVIVNISDDGGVTTEVKRELPMTGATATGVTTDREALDGGASQLAALEERDQADEFTRTPAPSEFDGGAGPSSQD